MGMFDTYKIQWGGQVEELQTKQLECIGDYWHIGQRVPLSQFGDSHYGNSAYETLMPGEESSFRSLVEDSTLGNLWHNQKLCDRHFVIGHARGVFADYASFQSHDQAVAHAHHLADLWNSLDLGPCLHARLSLVVERNNIAYQSLANAKASLNHTFMSWRSNMIEQKKTPLQPPKKTAMSIFRMYFGPDFTGVSRLQVEEAYDMLCAHWLDAVTDFNAALEPAHADTHAKQIALSAVPSSGGFLRPPTLGAPSPAALESLFHPAIRTRHGPNDCLEMIRLGQWSLYEKYARDHLADDQFIFESKKVLTRLCLSRLGASWAIPLMAKIPELLIDKIDVSGSKIPLIDWTCSGLGLPPDLIEPLFSVGAPLSAQLPHFCLLDSHSTLLSKALSSLGGIDKVEPHQGVCIAEQAVRTHNLPALRLIQEASGTLPRTASGGQLMVDLAFELDERASRHGFPPPIIPMHMDTIDHLPKAMACAAFLLQSGHKPSGAAAPSERMRAYLALLDREELDSASAKPRGKKATTRL